MMSFPALSVSSWSMMMFASQRFFKWLGPPAVLSTRFQSVHPTAQNRRS